MIPNLLRRTISTRFSRKYVPRALIGSFMRHERWNACSQTPRLGYSSGPEHKSTNIAPTQPNDKVERPSYMGTEPVMSRSWSLGSEYHLLAENGPMWNPFKRLWRHAQRETTDILIAGELTRRCFQQATAEAWYAEPTNVPTFFYNYTRLCTLHVWLMLQKLRSLTDTPRVLTGRLLEHMWNDFEHRMEHEEGINAFFLKKNLVKTQEQCYGMFVMLDEAYDKLVAEDPAERDGVELMVVLWEFLWDRSDTIDFMLVLETRDYVLEQLEAVDAWNDTDFLRGNVRFDVSTVPCGRRVGSDLSVAEGVERAQFLSITQQLQARVSRN